jgi:glycine dehydrogenase subunit 1
VLYAYPNFFGVIEDLPTLVPLAHEAGALAVVAADPIALALLTPPGELGADLCVGEALALGAPISLGGPACGFFAGKKEFARRFPGRIVGQTLDGRGRRGFVLTLQTREQHIRREKATSNICTNQGLIALMNTLYLSLLGKEGLVDVARLCFEGTHDAAELARAVPGVRLAFAGPFLREFALALPVPAREVILAGRERRVLFGTDGAVYGPECANLLLVAATEMRTADEIKAWAEQLAQVLAQAKGRAS